MKTECYMNFGVAAQNISSSSFGGQHLRIRLIAAKHWSLFHAPLGKKLEA
jgi:hypothetical protein